MIFYYKNNNSCYYFSEENDREILSLKNKSVIRIKYIDVVLLFNETFIEHIKTIINDT